MRRLRAPGRIATVVAASLTVLVMVPSTSLATTSAEDEVTVVLSNVGSGLVQQAVPSATDLDSAAQTATVDVPFDPTKGVTLKQGTTTTVVGLPDAQHLSLGQRLPNGVVVYHNTNGSDVVVVPTASGAQFLTVIENDDAPEDYTYPLSLSVGQTVRVTPGGYALVLDATGKPVSSIAAPWAVSQSGNVSTSFATDGSTLVQHIAHKASGTSYPVVADPNYAWYSEGVVITFSKWDTAIIGASAAFTPVWIAAAAVGGQLGNKLYQAIWYIQAIAAYDGAVGQCLWIWVPRNGRVNAGGYKC
jgi:hypothetical protein